MSELNLASELDRFREKLLDMTNRNPLLNYRKSRSRTLEIIDELPDQVFQRLVNDGKRFRFSAVQEEDAAEFALIGAISNHDSSPDNGGTSILLPQYVSDDESRHFDDRLQTAISPTRLDHVLKSMAREAASAIEETGVNYLFLAIGMLGWRDRIDTEKTHLAPLILVPVALSREFDSRNQKYEYAINWQGDELQYNLCLSKRLQKDFGIRLPAHDGEQLPEVYFGEVERAVRSQPSWAVKREQLLGFFSFQKMLMYLDLDPANWQDRPELSPDSIAGKLIAGGESDGGSCLYAPDYDIDADVAARDLPLVADADSSQHSALLDISQGKNLVIEGPPGTGKSQTITNAIAAAIQEGKKVLFVAEKLAALKVVSDRLTALELDKFCLELHSDGVPKQAYGSIKKRMNAVFRNPSKIDAIRGDVERRKEYITAYCHDDGIKTLAFRRIL